MSDQDLKNMMAKLIASQAETDAKLIKRDAQCNDTDEELNRIAKMVGAMGNNQGDVAEEYFVNSLKDDLELLGKHYDVLIPNFTIKSKHITDEYDILLVNGEELAMIEVKYKLHPNDIKDLEKKIINLKALPQYKNYKIYAGVAGFKVPQDTIELAMKNGYFVLQRKGDVIDTYAGELKVS
jgi:hypothetical protein